MLCDHRQAHVEALRADHHTLLSVPRPHQPLISLSPFLSFHSPFIHPSLHLFSREFQVTMKVAEASEPTIVQLKIRSKWLQNYKASDSDGASNYSAVKHPQPLPIRLHEMLCARRLPGSGPCDWNHMFV
jgi:hypothetical protein